MAEEDPSARKLRPKERKVYSDLDIDEDEIDGKRNFCLEEKLRSRKYVGNSIRYMKGDEVNLKFFQENGFSQPIIVKEKTGLGMRMPSENFKVSDVKQCVGSRRVLDVVDVTTQRGVEMTMKEWVKYYENPERERLLNVISLEFSHTKLENYVECPQVVRDIDWVTTVWPRHMRDCQTETTNIIEKMKYPKVRKYVLMSVAGCYTDFHIDMGGTSVWYHILHGSKIFWLIPPTEHNLELYETWTLSGKQGDCFFADQAEGCERIQLEAGWTFFIPTGWIHAVYTPLDSLVFGGNYLHCYNVPMQLRIRETEDRTRVPQKFRYPFYQEIHWYLLERYVSCVSGKNHRVKSEEELAEEMEGSSLKVDSTPPDSGDEKSDDSSQTSCSSLGQTGSRNKDVCLDSPPRSPIEEEHNYVSSPQPYSPASPISSQPTSPKPQRKTDENAPPKPKIISSPKSPQPSKSDGKIRASTPGITKPDKEQNVAKKTETAIKRVQSDADIKTYFSQSELIRPVSVKLENCLLIPEKTLSLLQGMSSQRPIMHMTRYELDGLAMIADWLQSLPINKRIVPRDVPNPDALIMDLRHLLAEHADDDPKLAATGKLILKWPPRKSEKLRKSHTTYYHSSKSSKGGKSSSSSSHRRRRVRCKRCEACTRTDCGECNFCRDMKKYGGPGRMKQSCVSRQCMAPELPTCAVCMICNKDDEDKTAEGEEPPADRAPAKCTMMECGICWQIVHPQCLQAKFPNLTTEGNVNEDLPNSWECPKCLEDGKQGQTKARVFKGMSKRLECRQSSTSSESSEDGLKREREITVKREPDTEIRKSVPIGVKTSPSRQENQRPIRAKPQSPCMRQDENIKRNSPVKVLTPPKEESPKGLKAKRRDLTADEDSPRKKMRMATSTASPRGGATGLIKKPMSPKKPVNLPARTSRGRERTRGTVGVRRGLLRAHRGQLRSFRGRIGSFRGRISHLRPVIPSTSQDSLVTEPEPGPSNEPHLQSIQDDPAVGECFVADEGVSEECGLDAVNKTPTLVVQRYVVRPAPIPSPPKFVETDDGGQHLLPDTIWMRVFSFLPTEDLCRCMRVCRTWNRWAIDRSLWSRLSLTCRRLRSNHLIGLVRRQPQHLDLSHTNISRAQLSWLVARLPQLQYLSLAGNAWHAVAALCCSACPLLTSLNLNWVSGLRDPCVKDLVTPPRDHRPGIDESISRLHLVRELYLAGSDITASGLESVVDEMPRLTLLDLSYCACLADFSLLILSRCRHLRHLDLTGCHQLSDAALMHLLTLEHLSWLSVRNCHRITDAGIAAFLQHCSRLHLVEEGVLQAV